MCIYRLFIWLPSNIIFIDLLSVKVIYLSKWYVTPSRIRDEAVDISN